MNTTRLIPIIWISTLVLAVASDLSKEIEAAFTRLSESQNYSFRTSSKDVGSEREDLFSGRVSRDQDGVWSVVHVNKGGPPTVEVIFKDHTGVLMAEKQWMTAGDIMAAQGSVKLPRDGMRTVFNIMTSPPLPAPMGLFQASRVESFRREGGRYVGQVSKKHLFPSEVKRTMWIEVKKGIVVKYGIIITKPTPGAQGNVHESELQVEISEVGSTKVEVPDGARARLETAEAEKEAEQDGADQPATARDSKPVSKEKPKPASKGRSQ